MATATVNKNKVSVLAKDFGMTSKDLVAALKNYTDTVKGPSQVLDERELSILFEYLTQKNQVDIATIFADTYQEKTEQEAEKKEAAGEKKDAQSVQNTQSAEAAPKEAADGKKPAPAQPKTQSVSRVPEKKIVDTRKAVNVNLDKYDEKLQDMAERSGWRIAAAAAAAAPSRAATRRSSATRARTRTAPARRRSPTSASRKRLRGCAGSSSKR